MRLDFPELREDRSTARLVATVEARGERQEWFVGAPADHIGVLDIGPDAFVPTAVLLAARLGEDLTIAGSVAPALVEGSRRAAALMASWWGWRPPEIQANPVEPTWPRGAGVGLFFTRGIDSSAGLIAGQRGELPAVTHLLGVDQIESLFSPRHAAEVWHDTETAAAEHGLPLVRLTTNLHTITRELVPWENAHGAVLIGLGLVLGPLLGTLMLASTVHADYLRPYGSHPGLDPLWTTERTKVQHVDAVHTRAEKIARVAAHPIASRHVKVCWERDLRGNCGRCAKCLLTMTGLAIAGATDVLAQFDARLTPESVRRIQGQPPVTLEETVDAIPVEHDALRNAWLDFATRARNGPNAGLLGLDVAARVKAARRRLRVVGEDQEVVGATLGWGPGAQPLRPAVATQHELIRKEGPTTRAFVWCLVDRRSAGATRLAAALSDNWGVGPVALTDDDPPILPPTALARLVERSAVRCWWSDDSHLDGVPFLETVEHGCIPCQVMDDQAAGELRRLIPSDLGRFVLGVSDLAAGPPTGDELRARWEAVLRVLVGGSLERDIAVGAL
jgi:hypothetical protein